MDPQIEKESPRNGLPLVSKEVRDQILDEMGLLPKAPETSGLQSPGEQLVRDYTKAITGEYRDQIAEKSRRIQGVAVSTFTDLADINPELVKAIHDALSGNLYAETIQDSVAAGMGFVLKAMHMQSDYKLLYDLGKLSNDDIISFKNTIVNRVKAQGIGRILEQAINTPRIPPQQNYLREIIDEPAKANSSLFDVHYKNGAGMMYQELSKWWPKLYSNQVPTSPPPTEPSGNL